jgi:hypothetical protein
VNPAAERGGEGEVEKIGLRVEEWEEEKKKK